jgi:hypothetical protein
MALNMSLDQKKQAQAATKVIAKAATGGLRHPLTLLGHSAHFVNEFFVSHIHLPA